MSGDGERADLRAMVRHGYDAISLRYRGDDGCAEPDTDEDVSRYAAWVEDLGDLLPRQAVVADLGCGCGVPTTDLMCRKGWKVVGVDFSAVQLRRARLLVPGSALVQADLAQLQLEAGCLDAAVSLYTLIHLPLADQRRVFDRIGHWLRPGGYLLAIVGAEAWTGVEPYLGVPMHWDHADTRSYLDWLPEHGLHPVWHRHIPEGDSGHTLLLARTSQPAESADARRNTTNVGYQRAFHRCISVRPAQFTAIMTLTCACVLALASKRLPRHAR